MSNDRAIHRTVSGHVLNYIPLTPFSSQFCEWPLGFMTERCKKDTTNNVQDSQFTESEMDVSIKLLRWIRNLDVKLCEALSPKNWVQERIGLEFREEAGAAMFYPPIAIRAKSGYGKSMLFGKLIAELVDAKFTENGGNEWPVYNRIVYSQLKDQMASNLEEAVCRGLDKFHQCPNLETFFELTKDVPAGQKILFIDSLDEHPEAKEWWNISLILSKNGWRVVWACRDPDWNTLQLSSQVKSNFYSRLDGNTDLHWEEYTGLTWDLEVPGRRLNYLKEGKIAKPRSPRLSQDNHRPIEWENDRNKNNKFLKYAYEATQLMHIFHTHHRLKTEFRDELDLLLVENLFRVRDRIISKNVKSNSTSHKEFLRIFNDPKWFNQFFDSNLAKVIIDTALHYASVILKSHTEEEIFNSWHNICQTYYQKNHPETSKSNGKLRETIFTPENDLNNISNKLLKKMLDFGILRESDGQLKFRHRDFAVVAYVNGSENGLDSLNKEDIIFSYFFPHSEDFPGSSSEQNQERRIEFLRRTGNVTSQIESLWKIEKLPVDLSIIAKVSIKLFLPKIEEEEVNKPAETSQKQVKKLPDNKGISESQRKSIELGADRSAIVLHGVPGSGKTFSGVERIIYRQVNLFTSGIRDSRALVVSLNDELAKSIDEELNGQHKNSPFLNGFNQSQIQEIINTIEVKSIKQIIEEWMPNVARDGKSDWLFSLDNLWDIFNEQLRERTKRRKIKFDRSWYRILLKDFQNKMFDSYSGQFKTQKDYLRDVRGGDIQPDVRKVWHDVIREFRERKRKLPLQEACALLRNQLLYYEFTESYASDFNPDYNYETELLPFDKDKSFSIFRDKFQNGYYDCIMVDEVQDLPIIAVNMLSFLSPSREPNRFILSGDKYQTLNGQEFLWEQFLISLTEMTARLSEEHSQFIFHDKNTKRPYDHHLKGLFWSKGAIDTVIKNRLVENFRNHPAINEITMHSWQNWPSPQYYEGSTEHGGENFTKMDSQFKRSTDYKDFKPIMVINTKNREDFIEKLLLILESINQRAGVSLLCASPNMRKYIQRLFEGEFSYAHDTDKYKIETFDPWTIKGLERNAVVVLGGYYYSSRDPDTKDLGAINLSKAFLEFEEHEREAIDLMRRKMLVSQTRAVEQLIIVDTPNNIELKLGGEEETFQSLNTMDFKSVETGSSIEYIEDPQDVEEGIREFFKASKILPEHISIKRFSEGIKLLNRTRNKKDKTDFENFKVSFRNILANDVHNSELEILINQLTNNTVPLARHNLIEDLMRAETDQRSYAPKGSKNRYEQNERDDYTTMIQLADNLTQSNVELWSLKGFEALKTVLDYRKDLSTRLRRLEKQFIEKYEHEFNELLEDINRVLNETKLMLRTFSTHHNLPKDNDIPKTDIGVFLLAYILSTANKMSFASYPGRLREEDFGKLVIRNLKQLEIGVTGEGALNLSHNNNNFEADGEVWNRLIEDLHFMNQQKGDIENPEFVALISKLAQSYSAISGMLGHLGEVSNENLKVLTNGNAAIIHILVQIGQEDDISESKQHILNFVSNEFPGLDRGEHRQLLLNISKKVPDWFDELDDVMVLNWAIKNFVAFMEALETDTPRHNKRILGLYSKSRHINYWINESISIERPVWDLSRHLNLTAKDDYSSYLQVLTTFSNSLLEKLKHSELDDRGIQNLVDVSVFRQSIALSALNHQEIFGDKYREEYRGLDSSIQQIYTVIRQEKKGKIYKKSLQRVKELLDALESDVDYLYGKSGKNFIREVLFLQSISKPTHIDEEFQQIPSLQKLNIFELEKVIEYPPLFMPPQPDENSEKNWIVNNKHRVFYPVQKDPLSRLVLVANVLENWELNMKLNEILSTTFNPASEDESTRLYWNNDGFGRTLDYDTWLKKNDQLYEFLNSEGVIHPVAKNVCVLHDKFDLDSRITKYLRVVDSLLNLLSNKKNSVTTELKPLLRDVVIEVFDLETTANEMYPALPVVQFEIVTCPKDSPLKIDYTKNAAKSKSQVLPMLTKPEFVRLVEDLIGYNQKGNPNVADSIASLEYHKELFIEFLNRYRKETAEHLNALEMQGHIIDEALREFLDGNSTEEESDIKVEDSLVDSINEVLGSEEEDFEFTDDFEVVGEGKISDLDEDSQNTLKAAVNDHLADLVFVADGQNDEKSLNQKVMEKFNLTLDDWEQLSYENRQKLREAYDILN